MSVLADYADPSPVPPDDPDATANASTILVPRAERGGKRLAVIGQRRELLVGGTAALANVLVRPAERALAARLVEVRYRAPIGGDVAGALDGGTDGPLTGRCTRDVGVERRRPDSNDGRVGGRTNRIHDGSGVGNRGCIHDDDVGIVASDDVADCRSVDGHHVVRQHVRE